MNNVYKISAAPGTTRRVSLRQAGCPVLQETVWAPKDDLYFFSDFFN